jgi:xylose dehydrogenase (NAD/NADP)
MAARQVRWGLISTARINDRLIPALRTDSRSVLVGIASRDRAKAEKYAKERAIPRPYGSYEAMLDDPEIDAVYISLPNGYHAEWSIRAAQAGKHVLCEKPLALSVDEVDRMTDAARRRGVVMQEAAMYRFHPQTHKVQALVTTSVIGEVRFLQATFTFTLNNRPDVRLDPTIGGGSLWDLGSYPVSFARTMLRANPIEVAAWQHMSDTGVDNTFTGQLYFEGGAVAQFASSFEAVPRWHVEIIGSGGRITLDQPYTNQIHESGRVTVISKGSVTTASDFGDSMADLVEETHTFEGNAYEYEVHSMAASILDGAPPVISLEDSRANVATLVALYRAADEHSVVRLAW